MTHNLNPANFDDADYSTFLRFTRNLKTSVLDSIFDCDLDDEEARFKAESDSNIIEGIYKSILGFVSREKWDETTRIGKREFVYQAHFSFESWTLSWIFEPP